MNRIKFEIEKKISIFYQKSLSSRQNDLMLLCLCWLVLFCWCFIYIWLWGSVFPCL